MMTTPTTPEDRARLSHGASASTIYDLVARMIARHHAAPGGGTLVDIGCGQGALGRRVAADFDRVVGCDLVRYPEFPDGADWVGADLNRPPYPIADGAADVTVAIETIEHLENPRAFMRELARITRPGGLVIVTTPNQLSLLSKMTLLCKNEFNAFQERAGLYPAHVTALLEIDLRRIAAEAGLHVESVVYTDEGRIPGTSMRWPRSLKGRLFSDNVLLLARRP